MTTQFQNDIIKIQSVLRISNSERIKIMLYSSQTEVSVHTFGLYDGIKAMINAGFPCIDLTMFSDYSYIFEPDWKETAKKLKKLAKENNVLFNQAHAPFGGGYEHYTSVLIPQFGRVFEFAGMLGIKNVVVHPLQKGEYYGHEDELFEMNMEFYSSIATDAKNAGVKIAIENMWQTTRVNHRVIDDVCADPRELIKYYDTLNDPDAFTICLDIGHVAICGREPQEAIKMIGHERLGALHVHDVDYISDLHTLPGLGKINWDEVCLALAKIDYRGELTLEADNFLRNFDDSFKPTALRFMSERAKSLACRIDSLRK